MPRHALPFSLPNLVDLRERARTLETIGAWIAVTPFKASVTGAGESEKIQYAIASHELFPMLGVVPARGQLFAETDDRRGGAEGIIVGHALWQRRLPGATIDDATLTLDGAAYRVIGVLPPDFRFATFPRSPDVWLPLGLDPSSGREYARGRIARQLMTESLAIALLGGIGGVLLATWLVAIPAVTSLAESSMFVPWAVDAASIPIDAPCSPSRSRCRWRRR